MLFLVEELKLYRYRNPLTIDLKFSKNLTKRERVYGNVIWEDDNHRPREFTIMVDKDLGPRKIIYTLIHEMVHVKQYASGRMKDLSREFGIRTWCGRKIDLWETPYWTQPWEVEARKMEKVFYNKWKEYNKKITK